MTSATFNNKTIILEKNEQQSTQQYEETMKALEKYLMCADKALRYSPHNKKIKHMKEEIENEISNNRKGYQGEQKVLYYLQNSDIPMYVMHDVYFQNINTDDDEKTNGSQIDYILVTQKNIYLIECKNWNGNLIINERGDFILDTSSNFKCVENPTTQNEIHLYNFKDILSRNNIEHLDINKLLKTFVVFSNPEMIVSVDEHAPQTIKSSVVKADMLSYYIKETDDKSDNSIMTLEQMTEIANCIQNCSSVNPQNYLKKFDIIKSFIAKRLALRIASIFIVLFTTILYLFYFYKFKTPILSGHANSTGIIDILTELFMIYSSLGITSGIICFVNALFRQTDSIVCLICFICEIIISVFTFALSLHISQLDSIPEYIFAILVLLIICGAWMLIGFVTFMIGKSIYEVFKN